MLCSVLLQFIAAPVVCLGMVSCSNDHGSITVASRASVSTPVLPVCQYKLMVTLKILQQV
jgi:hypothetical protein